MKPKTSVEVKNLSKATVKKLAKKIAKNRNEVYFIPHKDLITSLN